MNFYMKNYFKFWAIVLGCTSLIFLLIVCLVALSIYNLALTLAIVIIIPIIYMLHEFAVLYAEHHEDRQREEAGLPPIDREPEPRKGWIWSN